MRFRLAAAALAAMVLATPAAAQDNALEVMRGVLQRLAANTEGVQDYTLSLRSGELETEVYVYRDGDEWEVADAGDDEGAGGMLKALVVWPTFGELDAEFPDTDDISPEDLAQFGDAFTLSDETLDGRRAQVLFVRLRELMDDGEDDSEMPDSLRLYLDPESQQILRVHVAGSSTDMGDLAPGGSGSMEASMDFADYRETDGLTVPRALRMTLDVEMNLTEEQRTAMSAAINAARAQMEADVTDDARQMSAMMDIVMGLLTDGHLELPVTVESVRVNAGPPSWFEG